MPKIFASLVVLFSIVACNEPPKSTKNLFFSTQKELSEKLLAAASEANFNGFGVALVDDKDVLFVGGFGMASLEPKQAYNEHTVQNIASVTKTLLGIALLKAQELGKLKLDDPVNNYLPFKVVHPQFPDVPITLRQLATHTSSIVDGESYLLKNILLRDTIQLKQNLALDISPTRFNPPDARMSFEQFLSNILDRKGIWYDADVFSAHQPGEIYVYSNTGATLAALVIEKAMGMSYADFTSTHILRPLSMNESGWTFETIDFSHYTHTFQTKQKPYPYYSLITYPDGGLLTTSTDMSKYISELFKGYYGNGTLLSRESYKEYFTQQLKDENFIDRSNNEYSDEYNMGITMGFSPNGNFAHYGGDPGLFSMIYFDVKSNVGKYYISNTDGDAETGKFQKKIMDLLDEYAIKLKQSKGK